MSSQVDSEGSISTPSAAEAIGLCVEFWRSDQGWMHVTEWFCQSTLIPAFRNEYISPIRAKKKKRHERACYLHRRRVDVGLCWSSSLPTR